MKKILLGCIALTAFGAIATYAAPMDEESYITNQRTKAEQAGRSFSEEAARAKFKELDMNGNGTIEGSEWQAAKARKAAQQAQ